MAPSGGRGGRYYQFIGKLSTSNFWNLGIIEKLSISKNVHPISSDKLNRKHCSKNNKDQQKRSIRDPLFSQRDLKRPELNNKKRDPNKFCEHFKIRCKTIKYLILENILNAVSNIMTGPIMMRHFHLHENSWRTV